MICASGREPAAGAQHVGSLQRGAVPSPSQRPPDPARLQYAFPLLAMIVIYVFSFDQGAVSKVLRSRALQKLGLWSYSIYMIHVFVFQVMKMARLLHRPQDPSRARRLAQQ